MNQSLLVSNYIMLVLLSTTSYTSVVLLSISVLIIL